MKLLLVVLVFAAVTYLAIRWMQDRGTGGSPAQRRPSRPKPPTRPIAPDDDEKFLRDLEWKRRQQEKRQPKNPPELCPGPSLSDFVGGAPGQAQNARAVLDALPPYFSSALVSPDRRTANISFGISRMPL